MKKLEKEFNRRGFKFTKVYREGCLAIYERVGKGCKYWETIQIKQVPDQEKFGKVIEAHEGYPGDEEFGYIAYCCMSYDAAMKRIKELRKRKELANG